MSSIGPVGTVGHAQRDSRASRVISASDALWCARALMGEVGSLGRAERMAVLSVFVRGWLMSSQASLGTWVQGFSQPVNPRWVPGGDLWNAHKAALARGERQGQEGATSTAAGARRRRFRALSWLAIPGDVRADVVAVLSGAIDLSAGAAINFGGPVLYRRYGLRTSSVHARKASAPAAVVARETRRGVQGPRYVHVSGSGAGGNVFHSDVTSRESSFRVKPGDNVSAALPAPVAPPFSDGAGVPVPAVAGGLAVAGLLLAGAA